MVKKAKDSFSIESASTAREREKVEERAVAPRATPDGVAKGPSCSRRRPAVLNIGGGNMVSVSGRRALLSKFP